MTDRRAPTTASIETLAERHRSTDRGTFELALVRVRDYNGDVTVDWELSCEDCDYFATHLSEQECDEEIDIHDHVHHPLRRPR